MRTELKAHIYLLITAIIYGANFTIAKVILNSNLIMPMGLVYFRVLAAFILFYIFHSIYIKEEVEKKDLWQIFKMSLFGIIINQSFFIIGLKNTTPINAALLITVVPIIVFIFSALIAGEKMTWYKILGISSGFIGVVMIILKRGNISINSGTFLGDIFVFLNSVSYGYYMVKIKPLFLKYNAITVTKWMFLFALVVLLPFSFNDIISTEWERFDLKSWFSFGYVLIFTTFFAYLLGNLALNSLSPSVVSIYIYLQPLIATAIALILAKDVLDISKILSGLLIFSGIYLVSIKKKE